MSRRGYVRCSRCGEGFREPRDLALHRGRVHGGDLAEGERASFEVALEEERAWLASFRRHVRSGLATLPVFLVYVIVALSGYAYQASATFILLPLPGILGFAALTYFMAYRHQGSLEAS